MEKFVWVASPEVCKRNHERALERDRELAELKEMRELEREGMFLTIFGSICAISMILIKIFA